MVDDVEEFIALCASVLTDSEVTEEEAYQLGDWLNHHEAAAEHWPCDQLIEPLQAVWADGAANPQELQRLARVLISLQEEWATYYKSLGPAANYSYVPNVGASLTPVPSPVPHPSSAKASLSPSTRPKRRGWIMATASIAIVLVAAGLFAVREMKFAHHDPATAASSPVVSASPVPSRQTSLVPPRSAAAQALAKPATPSAAWTVTTRQNVKTKAGKKEIIIPKGTTVKVIARTDRDLMISYKGEDLTIPASATTSSR